MPERNWTRFKEAFQTRDWIEEQLSQNALKLAEHRQRLEAIDNSIPSLTASGDRPETLAGLQEERTSTQSRLDKADGERRVLTARLQVLRLRKDQEDTVAFLDGPEGPSRECELVVAGLRRAFKGAERGVQSSKERVEERKRQAAELMHRTEALEALTAAREALEAAREESRQAKDQLECSEDMFGMVNEQLTEVLSTKEGLHSSEPVIANFKGGCQVLRAARTRAHAAARAEEAAERRLEEAQAALMAEVEATAEGLRGLGNAIPMKQELRLALQLLNEARAELQAKEDELDRVGQDLQAQLIEKATLDEGRRLAYLKADVVTAGARLTPLFVRLESAKVQPWDIQPERLVDVLNADELDELVQRSRDFTGKLSLLCELESDEAQLRELYAERICWPESWWPPSINPREQNWVKVRALFEVETEKVVSDTAGKIKNAILDNQAKVLGNAGVLAKMGIRRMTPAVERLVQRIGSGLAVLVDLGRLGLAIKGGVQSSEDPIEQLLLVEEQLQRLQGGVGSALANLANGLTATDLNEVAAWVPGVGAADALVQTACEACRAVETWKAAFKDAEVHQQALDEGHRVEAAADHVQSRTKHLAGRKSAKAAANAIKLASHICTLAGVTAPVAVALSFASTGVKALTATGAKLFDITRAEEARAILLRAQAGDVDAREEIFRHHGRYATGLVALMAEDGDPLALALCNNHGVTEAMIHKSSAIMLRRYLMKQLEETDEPMTWTGLGEKVKSKLDTVGGALSGAMRSVGAACAAAAKMVVDPHTDYSRALNELQQHYASMPSADTMRRLTAELHWAQDQVDELERALRLAPSDEHEDIAGQLSVAQEAVAATQRDVAQLEAKVDETLSAIGEIARILRFPNTGSNPRGLVMLTREVKEQHEAQIFRVLSEQRACLEVLTMAA
ncbi:MAG: hypothetical protein H6741_18675 [Alphaproteobacteria bacterium]|nr:hypothetical protein [Alphaproteobacteria bacterium]MCB9794735.1 hypothetical protein [Alphaproteobacteria bacterium]